MLLYDLGGVVIAIAGEFAGKVGDHGGTGGSDAEDRFGDAELVHHFDVVVNVPILRVRK